MNIEEHYKTIKNDILRKGKNVKIVKQEIVIFLEN